MRDKEFDTEIPCNTSCEFNNFGAHWHFKESSEADDLIKGQECVETLPRLQMNGETVQSRVYFSRDENGRIDHFLGFDNHTLTASPFTKGHGWVKLLPDGIVARCGGPALCGDCAKELASAAPQEQKEYDDRVRREKLANRAQKL